MLFPPTAVFVLKQHELDLMRGVKYGRPRSGNPHPGRKGSPCSTSTHDPLRPFFMNYGITEALRTHCHIPSLEGCIGGCQSYADFFATDATSTTITRLSTSILNSSGKTSPATKLLASISSSSVGCFVSFLVSTLAAYKDPYDSTLRYINGRDIQDVLRTAVTAAFPNPHHRVYEVLNKFSAHSLRVTPAMALLARGFTPDVVAHILRWNSDAIKRYMRDPRLTRDKYFLAIPYSCELISDAELAELMAV